MKKSLYSLFALSLAWLALSPALADEPVNAFDPANSDPRAVEIADRVMESMGGQEAWDATRYLSFNFFGFRSHLWDRYGGDHRLEGKTRDGDEYVVLHNIHSRDGRAWKKGEELEGEELAEMLERAYGAWVNDTYWLIMPYKMKDPGVTLAYDGEETRDGKTYDKVILSFEGVGLTPKDRYWAYINRETGLMDRWAYVLQGRDEEPKAWDWLGWKRFGRILLSEERSEVGGERRPSMAPVEVLKEVPDSRFREP